MSFWKKAGGILRLELTGAEPENSLQAIALAGIAMEQIHRKGALTLEFVIQHADYAALEALCRKRGETLRVLGRYGLFYAGKSLLKRKLLLTGISLLIAMTALLPTRTLFIQVAGNQAVPAAKILAEAEKAGLVFGVCRRDIRSEQLKNALLDAIPELEWAGVNTRGCTAVISVRERAEQKTREIRQNVGNIVAARDGYILSALVTRGTGLVQPGQAVRAGEILISGYTDCGICIQATQAAGEVLAETRRQLEVHMPEVYQKKGMPTGTKRVFSLLIGKKRIFFWKDSGILEGSCDRIQREYPLTLPGGFRLPVSVRIDTCINRELSPEGCSPQEASASLEGFCARYLTEQMLAGRVLKKTQHITRQGGAYRLRGSYLCAEIISRQKLEQNGVPNGKASGQNRERGAG